ncbi:MAG: mechanosensitive ion channel family protein [Hormoscilla sp.]
MLDYFQKVANIEEIERLLPYGLQVVAVLLALLGLLTLPILIISLIRRLLNTPNLETAKKIFAPYKSLLWGIMAIALAEVAFVMLKPPEQLAIIEIILSLTLTVTVGWLASGVFRQFFNVYAIDAAFKSGRRVNSELLLASKFIANFIIIVLGIIIFAETHQINVFGIVASLGVGGIAVAFAAQNTLSQLLGGIVIYIDRPFVVDDYIGLPDGTFGRVESIGLRSTKIRTSGKGTLVIVPNSSLTEVSIENFTGAKKVMSLLYLTFYRTVAPEEQALIREVILESTRDIFGIDTGSTNVTFRSLQGMAEPEKTQAQITFFILGSGEVSMELRRQLLNIASQNITMKLKEYGISFDIEQPSIYVDSPIAI